MSLEQSTVSTQHADSVVNKQVKGKILARRINVQMEPVKASKSRDSLHKRKENNLRKMKPMRKHPSSAEAPACFSQRGRLCDKNPEQLELIPVKFTAQYTKTTLQICRTTDTKLWQTPGIPTPPQRVEAEGRSEAQGHPLLEVRLSLKDGQIDEQTDSESFITSLVAAKMELPARAYISG